MNYYELLEIRQTASLKEIIMSYENKITKYNNIKKLSSEQIDEVKMLKIALHVLTKLRNKYNQYLNKISKSNSTNKTNDEPIAINQDQYSNLDALFKIDDTWKIGNKTKTDDQTIGSRKSKFETNTLGDRIFSLSELNKRPGYSSDFEIELRKSHQGREDKSESKINKI